MTTLIHQRVEAARAGTNQTVICRMPSGWAVLCDMQYLSGYSLLLPDPVVGSINELDRAQRTTFLCDMVTIGDALLEVTGAFRINYGILGNSDPALHAHITPRYMSEPEANRRHLPWSYSKEIMGSDLFDYQRDKDMIARLAEAIQRHL